MERIDPDALATHLEVALTCTPHAALYALTDSDSRCRRRAAEIIARHLADRLSCFDFAFESEVRAGSQFPLLSEVSIETDDLLSDYPEVAPGDLAASSEQSKAGYDGTSEEADAIIAELQCRARAGVRMWDNTSCAK